MRAARRHRPYPRPGRNGPSRPRRWRRHIALFRASAAGADDIRGI